jgi:hypothetical protein
MVTEKYVLQAALIGSDPLLLTCAAFIKYMTAMSCYCQIIKEHKSNLNIDIVLLMFYFALVMRILIRLFYVFFTLLAGVHSFVTPARKLNVAARNRVLGKTCEPFHFLKNPSFLGLFYAVITVYSASLLNTLNDLS